MNNNLIRLLGAALLVSSGMFVVSCGGGNSASDNKMPSPGLAEVCPVDMAFIAHEEMIDVSEVTQDLIDK